MLGRYSTLAGSISAMVGLFEIKDGVAQGQFVGFNQKKMQEWL
jgi:hypothetical protein